jgi:hypothetical protein
MFHASVFDRFNDAYNDVLEAYKEQQVDTTIVEPEIKRACTLNLLLMDSERNLKDDKWWSGLVASAIGYEIPATHIDNGSHLISEEACGCLLSVSVLSSFDQATKPLR